LRDAGVVRADHHHSVDVRLEDPRDLPATARHLQRHPIGLHQALRQQRQSLRRARHPSAGPNPAVLTDPPHRSHGEHRGPSRDRPTLADDILTSHDTVDMKRENQRDIDTDRYELEAQSRQVAGAAERKARARSPSRKPAYPPAFSQQSPCRRSLDATAGPGQSLQRAFSCREEERSAERAVHAEAALCRLSTGGAAQMHGEQLLNRRPA
jgi:hypothetical protein